MEVMLQMACREPGSRKTGAAVVAPQRQRSRLCSKRIACFAGIFGLALTNAALAETNTNDATRPQTAHLKKKKHRAAKVVQASEIQTKAPIGALPPSSAVSTSPARFDKTLGLKGWDIPFPSFGDTITQDAGGWRSTLASYGIGFMEYNATVMAANMLNTPTSNKGQQAYWGQSPSIGDTSVMFMTVDLGHYGIPGGQLQASAAFSNSTWDSYLAQNATLNRLAYYQSLLDNKLELLVGFVGNGTAFVGPYVGGNLASPFGQSASIPFELGLSNTPAVAPTAQVKVNFTPNFYDQFAVQRSLSPTANSFLTNSQVNPTGFDFNVPGAKALYINEFGYKNAATPNDPYTWVRAGGIYNTSEYTDYSKPGATRTNSGAYILADRQLWEMDPSSPATAYRGLYAGGTFMWAAPETNVISQYYEGRLYVIGPFASRPKDQIGLVYTHSVFTSYLADLVNKTSALTGMFAQHDSTTITTTYTYNLSPGVYLTGGVAYTDHPSFEYIKNEGPSLSFLGAIFTVF
jgi:porin